MIAWKQAMAAVGNDVQPVYILRGSESALAERIVEKIRRQVERRAGQQTGVVRYWFDGDGLDHALRACQSVGLFGTGDVVVLEQCAAFGSGKLKVDTGHLEHYLENPVMERVLVVRVPDDAWDERKKLTKLAKRHVVIDCSTPKADAIPDFIGMVARERGVALDKGSLSELARRVPSITMAERELEKLAAYGDDQSITVADVQNLVPEPVEDNVFAWIDAVMRGQAQRAFDSIGALIQGNDPLGLLALIARQARLMWYAKWGRDRGLHDQSIASKVGAHPYAVRVASQQVGQASLADLEDVLIIVADAEYAVKSGRRDPRQALDWVVMSCLASKAPVRRVR